MSLTHYGSEGGTPSPLHHLIAGRSVANGGRSADGIGREAREGMGGPKKMSEGLVDPSLIGAVSLEA